MNISVFAGCCAFVSELRIYLVSCRDWSDLAAAEGGHTTTALALLQAGADFNIENEVSDALARVLV
jgi:hypothetical protein